MALKKIRLLWGTPPLPDGTWRLGLVHLQQTVDPSRPLPPGGVPKYWKGYLHHTLNLSVRGLLAWGAVATLAAYFAGAALLLHRYGKNNPHNRVTYADLVLPHRWSEVRRLRAESFAALGHELAAAGKYLDALGLLRLALDRNPGDFAARHGVAEIYVALRLRPQAVQLLRAGLDVGYPGRDCLELLFTLAEEGDQPELWLASAERARAALDKNPPADVAADEAAWLDRQTVRALVALGRRDDALAFVRARFAETDNYRRELEILLPLDQGCVAEASAAARRWMEINAEAREPLRLLTRAAARTGDFATMDAALARLRELDPTKPDPLLYATVQCFLAGREDAAAHALDELFFRFGAQPALYAQLAPVLAEVKYLPALDRLETEMRDRGFSLEPALWARLQLGVGARDWPTVAELARRLRELAGGKLSPLQAAMLDAFSRLAVACVDAGSGAQAALIEIITDRPGTLRLYQIVLRALLESDRVETARHVLTLAEGPYPDSRSILKIRAEIEQRLAARPREEVAQKSAPDAAFASLESFTRAFQARLSANQPAAALTLADELRRARPNWLATQTASVEALELPLRARGDDPLVLQLLARTTLARQADGSKRLLELARAIHAEGHDSNAMLLVKEILRRNPGDDAAIAQLALWEKSDKDRQKEASFP